MDRSIPRTALTPAAAVRIGEHKPVAVGRQAAVAGRSR